MPRRGSKICASSAGASLEAQPAQEANEVRRIFLPVVIIDRYSPVSPGEFNSIKATTKDTESILWANDNAISVDPADSRPYNRTI